MAAKKLGIDKFELLSRDELLAEVRRLDALINSPHTAKFLESTRIEVAHQVDRWGTVHDRAKEPADWFWLVGYLSGKALAAHIAAKEAPSASRVKLCREKALHHTISSAAALGNWHAAISCADSRMAPGSSDIQRMVQETFGKPLVAA